MFHRIRRRKQDPFVIEARRRHQEMWEMAQRMPCPPAPAPQAGPVPPQSQVDAGASEPVAEVDDFLPPELRVPSHDQVDGWMMPWPWPLVLDGEVVTCTGCGAYRDWIIMATRAQIWLRCRAGHQQQERRLDVAWFNRHPGPAADNTLLSFEDCLRHLGH
ncbi:hypothetical protein Srubr_37500 [Streptomyces rubradiris]|uniref:Uncharacterized protein n=1 Tax=Streptomyces rubradiris TaxID=285531 RepID=A0ABQ3RDI3_STRRR|nr:hypothetical protein [Streptomyces rubradiris]GHG95535.1 hypothetical protein GCM10018792_06410 [Streptomyces rubradiris]GHI53904.1 hypothetical protein Srubr_37500 [Streptomyces rubradiris]